MAMESPSSVRQVVVRLRATGDAHILKLAKFKIPGSDKLAEVIDFLCRQLHRETLSVYVNSAFSPNPDESVIHLYGGMGLKPNEFVDLKVLTPDCNQNAVGRTSDGIDAITRGRDSSKWAEEGP